MFSGKKVLFISPAFFGYEKSIIEELTDKGAQVDYFNERPFKSSLSKILNRLNVKIVIKNTITKYYDSILTNCLKNKYDYLLVISPETMDRDFIEKVKSSNPEIKTILYMWDSFKNKPGSLSIMNLFDRIVSFDYYDACNFDNVDYLPLFYEPKFSVSNRTSNFKYAASFIGTIHSDRVKVADDILNQLKAQGYNTFSFYYCPSRLLFILKKIFTGEVKHISYSQVSFESMSKSEVSEVFKQSNCILDINHPSQTGLTIRCLESLGAKKKIITTNESISEYDFYNPENIMIVNRHSPIIPVDFVCGKYYELEESVYKKYSLSSWIENVFCI